MALFHQEFYAQYNGKTQSFFNYEAQDLIITVHKPLIMLKNYYLILTAIYKIELWNGMQKLMEEERQQIDKVVI